MTDFKILPVMHSRDICTAGIGGSPADGMIWRFPGPGMGRMA